MDQRIYHMWDHPLSSASVSRNYVRTLLQKKNKNKVGQDVPSLSLSLNPKALQTGKKKNLLRSACVAGEVFAALPIFRAAEPLW